MSTSDKSRTPSSNDLPLGFGMALAQNEKALENYTLLDERQKQRFLYEARHARSHDEMQSVVERIRTWQG